MLLKHFLRNNRFGIRLGSAVRGNPDYELVSPLAKSVKVMLVLGLITLVLSAVELTVLKQAVGLWSNADELFSLIAALFVTFWLVIWTLPTVLLLFATLVLMFGRMVVVVQAGMVDFVLGVPGIGVRFTLAAKEINDAILVDAEPNSIFARSGKQIKIITELSNDNSAFGSDMTLLDLNHFKQAVSLNKMRETNLDALESSVHASVPIEAVPQSQSLTQSENSTGRGSLVLLILANLVPLFGVLFLRWDLSAIMVLYWAETGIIVLVTCLGMIIKRPIAGTLMSLFTVAHAGAFMAIHFLFIWTLFVTGFDESGSAPGISGDLVRVKQYMFTLWPALLAMTVSHLVALKSTISQGADISKDSIYPRIIMMHVTIIVGGGLVSVFGNALAALVLLVFLKLAVDIRGHLKQNVNL
ncbi:DUF6498-containing protein [Arenicella xantha]|uniref:Uncharacterized protein n=1 Tax=Arenicella xantha TaxID=644221 RepID=A0A395JFK5_9GAMM|nr:DUF6498-containing protein [Arenicella xantha]RBP47110.1 hypothetical protein DFR28_11073 [Arenicella xantha]